MTFPDPSAATIDVARPTMPRRALLRHGHIGSTVCSIYLLQIAKTRPEVIECVRRLSELADVR